MVSEILTNVWNFVVDKWSTFDNYLISKGYSLYKLALILGLIIAAILLLRFLTRLRKRDKISLLVSKGEIRQGRDFKPVISLRLSNMNRFPLQVLELSVDSDSMPMPEIVELAELVGPDEVISIESEFEQSLVGEEGVLHLFAYLPKRANQLYRLKAKYSFEPWAGRYKISPFKQSIKKVRQLDSELVNKSKSSPLNQKLIERSRSEIEAIKEKKNFEQSQIPKKAIEIDNVVDRIKPNLQKNSVKQETLPVNESPIQIIETETPKPRIKQDLKFPKDF